MSNDVSFVIVLSARTFVCRTIGNEEGLITIAVTHV